MASKAEKASNLARRAREKGKAGDFADCLGGGFVSLGKDLASMANAFAGRGSCYFTPAEAAGLMAVASTAIILMNVHSLIGSLTGGPVKIIAHVIGCAAKALGLGFPVPTPDVGGGHGPSMGYGGTGPGGACFPAGTPVRLASMGVHPTFTQVPPNSFLSRTAVLSPSPASRLANEGPD